MDTKSYLSFAEDDYKYFMDSYNANLRANAMAAIAQNACEKYLKHLIDNYTNATTAQEEKDKFDVMKTHSLNKLLQYLEEYTEISDKQFSNIKLADGYYFSARYPGDDSIEVKQRDIDSCKTAIETCRQFVNEKIQEFELSVDKNINHSSIEQQILKATTMIDNETKETINFKFHNKDQETR